MLFPYKTKTSFIPPVGQRTKVAEGLSGANGFGRKEGRVFHNVQQHLWDLEGDWGSEVGNKQAKINSPRYSSKTTGLSS